MYQYQTYIGIRANHYVHPYMNAGFPLAAAGKREAQLVRVGFEGDPKTWGSSAPSAAPRYGEEAEVLCQLPRSVERFLGLNSQA